MFSISNQIKKKLLNLLNVRMMTEIEYDKSLQQSLDDFKNLHSIIKHLNKAVYNKGYEITIEFLNGIVLKIKYQYNISEFVNTYEYNITFKDPFTIDTLNDIEIPVMDKLKKKIEPIYKAYMMSNGFLYLE